MLAEASLALCSSLLGGAKAAYRELKMQNPGGDFIETHLIQTAIRSEMVMLIAAEVNRGMRAARLALQKGEQTLLHGRAEMSEAELWNIYTQLSNENERKLDTSVERVLEKKKKELQIHSFFCHYIKPPHQNKVQLSTLLCGLKYQIFPERYYER